MHWGLFVEPPIWVIWNISAVFSIFSLTSILVLFATQRAHSLAQARQTHAQALWADCRDRLALGLPVPAQCLTGDPGQTLVLCVRTLAKLAPGARAQALERLRDAPVMAAARALLAQPRWADPLMLEASATLAGWLCWREARLGLQRLLKHSSEPVAFAAGLALVRIDTRELPAVWQLPRVQTWSRAAWLTLLRAVPIETANALLAERIAQSSSRDAAQLLLAWAQLPGGGALAYSDAVLADAQAQGWMLCAALRIQQDATRVGRFRHLLDHPRWAVQLQALQAVGRLGVGGDLGAVAAFAEHDNWWLATRAKQWQASPFQPRGLEPT